MSSSEASHQPMDDRAREAVAKARPSRKICLIISVSPGEDLARVHQIEDLAFRIKELDAVYKNTKQPIIDLMCAAGVNIIDGLEGTPQLIASAPARAWRKLLDQHPSVLDQPNVHISSNEPEWRV